ncbi:MAG: hypothetical protein A3F84_25835 [Candidatus Handelsmanbacteria bacterium RIFCSPLOWO2_12_FULL_64_10]|uniref:DUF58 domain-containing protein n=1 Tax=Handelsmanbacteria sp. (strain RIFCSPLOWO2_12_FULL_64_10) TaxID=1817868 RepID=A0A1F6CSH3_HANXR|nr:MAG: hypothetical protein A3F84_25835 [Candidatus Handelsmanbacteria bacterium RIFCSPLOWO2_12_FULL_64_10]
MGALLGVIGVLLFIGVIRSQPPLILFCCLLGGATLLSALWSRRSRERVTYRRSFEPARIFPGEESDYVIEITNRKRLPLPWAELEERLPKQLVAVYDPDVTVEGGWHRRRTISLGWHERLVLRQRFTCRERGEYLVGPSDLETGDPLGIFPVNMHVPETRSLIVYPRIAALDWEGIRSRFPFGPIRARPPVLEDPSWFAGIRDYRPGDPRHWVDWKATARRQRLQTRVFTPTTLTNVVVALNMQTLQYAWQGYDEARLEASIGVAAALVRNLLMQRCAVGLAANSSGGSIEQFQAYLPPSQRPSQLAEALAMLARLSAIPTLAFGAFLRRVAANFPYGASLIVVAAYLDEESIDEMALLAERGHSIELFFLGPELPPDLPREIPVITLTDVDFEPLSAMASDNALEASR